MSSEATTEVSTNRAPKSAITVAEVMGVCFIWLIAAVTIGFVAVVYHGDQSVSLENAIAYIVLGTVALSALLLFRDLIVEKIRHL